MTALDLQAAQEVLTNEPIRLAAAEHALLPLPRASSGALEMPFSNNVRQAVCTILHTVVHMAWHQAMHEKSQDYLAEFVKLLFDYVASQFACKGVFVNNAHASAGKILVCMCRGISGLQVNDGLVAGKLRDSAEAV